MPVHITVGQAVDWGANKLLSSQNPSLSEARKEQIRSVTKYNLLVNAFNGSTVLLAVAAVAAVFFAYTAAFVFGAFALFARSTTETELRAYTVADNVAGEVGDRLRRAVEQLVVRHGMEIEGSARDGQRILTKIGAKPDPNFVPVEVKVFGYNLWLNKAQEPDPIVAQQQPSVEATPMRAAAPDESPARPPIPETPATERRTVL